jgi:hypothetical protein
MREDLGTPNLYYNFPAVEVSGGLPRSCSVFVFLRILCDLSNSTWHIEGRDNIGRTVCPGSHLRILGIYRTTYMSDKHEQFRGGRPRIEGFYRALIPGSLGGICGLDGETYYPRQLQPAQDKSLAVVFHR